MPHGFYLPLTARITALIVIVLLGLKTEAQPPNVVVYSGLPGNYPPCEPSIAISRKSPKNLVAGAVLNYVFYSSDTGKTWRTERLRSKHGVYGDPCVVADERGRFYYFHLSDPDGVGWSSEKILDRIVCQKSRPPLHRWTRGSSIGHNPPKDQDKEWAYRHVQRKILVVTWTEFDQYNNPDTSCRSRILVSYSKNGRKWSPTHVLSRVEGNCVDNSGTAEGATTAADATGRLHSVWSVNGNLVHATYTHNDIAAKNEIPNRVLTDSAHWSFDIPGIGRANGMPVICSDLSNGPNHGNLYVVWCDQRKGADNTEVWFMRSTDGGDTWSKPVSVAADANHRHQFFAWMCVDQITGNIHIVYYDRRNHPDHATDVYLATSRDGGLSFTEQRISESPFYPTTGIFFGDYNNIDAHNGIVRPVWTRYENGTLSIVTAIINE
ncbi:MAG: hypothetical protein Kow0075_09460 [Salibacteraceae bacterium]